MSLVRPQGTFLACRGGRRRRHKDRAVVIEGLLFTNTRVGVTWNQNNDKEMPVNSINRIQWWNFYFILLGWVQDWKVDTGRRKWRATVLFIENLPSLQKKRLHRLRTRELKLVYFIDLKLPLNSRLLAVSVHCYWHHPRIAVTFMATPTSFLAHVAALYILRKVPQEEMPKKRSYDAAFKLKQ